VLGAYKAIICDGSNVQSRNKKYGAIVHIKYTRILVMGIGGANWM